MMMLKMNKCMILVPQKLGVRQRPKKTIWKRKRERQPFNQNPLQDRPHQYRNLSFAKRD
jgi:hypothetical protein